MTVVALFGPHAMSDSNPEMRIKADIGRPLSRIGLDRADRPGGSADEHRHERRHGISDHRGHDVRADPPAHTVRARIVRASMKSGTDVLCTAPPFKISRKPRCIRC
jgi:hypothetical protein